VLLIPWTPQWRWCGKSFNAFGEELTPILKDQNGKHSIIPAGADRMPSVRFAHSRLGAIGGFALRRPLMVGED